MKPKSDKKYGDTNYLKLYHIKLLAGRNIKASDTANEYVINETYMHILGFQNPERCSEQTNRQILPIVGVMGDFNQESLHSSDKTAWLFLPKWETAGNCILH